jgi:hypothetical protein
MAVLTEQNGTIQQGDANAGARGVQSGAKSRQLSDDEILGLGERFRSKKAPVNAAGENLVDVDPIETSSELDESAADGEVDAGDQEGAEYRDVFEARPELKQAWDDAQAYREAFATPDEARTATKMLADVRAMDALFYSKRPEDHAQLAHLVAQLDPAAFASLAKAMNELAANADSSQGHKQSGDDSEAKARGETQNVETESVNANAADSAISAQRDFLQAANAEAVAGVLRAIEAQAERVLPANVSKGARNRVVGEIYRELDKSLQANPDFAKQVRSAVRTGRFDAGHQNAVASLIVSRARQSLPSVAKRVLNEWTSTILAANQERAGKQRSAESRVDIAGASGGKERQRPRSPREIDYSRMSDADILNL